MVAWTIAPGESAELAKAFIADAIHAQGIEGGQLTIHADRGSSMTSKPVAQLRTDNPADAARRQAVKDMLAEWRWLNTRIKTADKRVANTLAIHASTLTAIFGIGTTGAATIVAIVDDIGGGFRPGATSHRSTAPRRWMRPRATISVSASTGVGTAS